MLEEKAGGGLVTRVFKHCADCNKSAGFLTILTFDLAYKINITDS